MNTKETFTHPEKKGADQTTKFVHVKYPDSPMGERDRAQVSEETKSRGEDRFKSYPTAR